jgi:hypothetical protein
VRRASGRAGAHRGLPIGENCPSALGKRPGGIPGIEDLAAVCREGDAIPLVAFSPQDANPAFAAQFRSALIKSRTSIDDLIAILRKRLEGSSLPSNDKNAA